MIYPAFFHYLFELLTSKGIDFPGAGLMHYITFRALMAAIIAIFCSLLIGKRIIKDMHKKQIGEEIRNLGLEGQLRKEGTPTMGVTLNGAVRGIRIGSHTLQVFEIAKVGLVLYLARVWEAVDINTFKRYFLLILLPIIVVCGLIIMNSFSTAMLVALLAILILFVIGIKPWYLWATIGGGIVVLVLLFGIYKTMDPNKPDSEKSSIEKIFNRFGTAEGRVKDFIGGGRMERSGDTVDLTQEQLDEMRQSENAKIAISEGGIFGKGPGKSTQRYSLSMAFSDFIYAFIVEEYGLLGGIFVLLLYIWFLNRGIELSTKCNTEFGGITVVGLTLLIVAQAMLHILVNVRLIPITGHTLPLISHGGSAYIVLCGAFGIILSLSRTQIEQTGKKLQGKTAKNA